VGAAQRSVTMSEAMKRIAARSSGASRSASNDADRTRPNGSPQGQGSRDIADGQARREDCPYPCISSAESPSRGAAAIRAKRK
jgi:hypothetical protein